MINKVYKISLLLVLLSSLLVACTDNQVESLFDGTINERTAKLTKEYTDALTAPADGWIGYYAPNAKTGGFALLLKFDTDGNVKLASDYGNGNYDNTVTYRINKSLKMQLVFESHSVLSQIYETNKNSISGEYVFYVLEASADKIVLQSATDLGFNGLGITNLELKPATAAQWNLKTIIDNTPRLADGYNTDKFFRGIYVEGTDIKGSFTYVAGYNSSRINRYATIKRLVDGKVENIDVPLAITDNGFTFINPYTINGKKVKNFTYDEKNNQFVSTDGGQTTIVKHSDTPPVMFYPASNMGMDGSFSSQLFFKSYWYRGITSNSSVSFMTAYNNSGMQRFYIDLNTDNDGKLSKKLPCIVWMKMGDGKYRALVFVVNHVENEKIIFKLASDLTKSFPKEEYRNLAKPLIDILGDDEGFYVEPYIHPTPFGNYDGFIYISVKNPSNRFCTVLLK